MSINTELNLLKNTKENLRTAIMEKGVVVSSSDLFSTYPTRISQISTQSGTYDESLKKLLDGSYTSYEIPNGTEKLKTDMFRSYTSLASITIPPTIKTVGSYAFKDCTSLNRVNITDLSAWCGIDFKTAESGSDISSNPLRTADRLYMNGTQITNLVIPSDVTEIKPYVFYSASGFTSVVIPDSVTTIGSDAFRSCSGLNTVEIGTGITSIGTRAFYYCSRLTSITVKAETPPTIGSVVFNDTNNCPIYVSEDSVQSYKTAWPDLASRIQAIPVNTFAMMFTPTGGGTPIEVELEDLATAGVIEKTDVPAAIKNGTGSLEIGDGVVTIGTEAFKDCANLTSVTIADSVTTIREYPFSFCSGLTSIDISNFVTAIPISMCYLCESLTNVDIPDSVTTIGNYAFEDCPSLTTVTIGTGIQSIGDGVFGGYEHSSSNLTSVTIKATTPPSLSGYTFNDENTGNIINQNLLIIVPVTSVDAYKTAWSAYADRIVGEGVAYWKLIGSECETDGSGKNTGYVTNTYEDVNPSSSTYGNTRTEYVQDEVTCPISAATEFRRITDISDVTSGKYIIVDTATGKALNASLIKDTTSSTNGINGGTGTVNCIDVTIENDTITADANIMNAAADYDANNKNLSWTDTENEQSYFIQWKSSSTYAYGDDRFNQLNNTIPKTVNGNVTFNTSGSATRSIGKHPSNVLIKFYSESNPPYYTSIALFKLDE